MILNDPVAWGAMISPKIRALLPAPIKTVIINTAILDIAVGIFLIINIHPIITFLAALFGSFHLIIVLTAAGIDEVTVRDIGLLGGTISLAFALWPEKFKIKRKEI